MGHLQDLSFDDIAAALGDEDAQYYATSAMEYLAELGELKDEMVNCAKALREKDRIIGKLKLAVKGNKTFDEVDLRPQPEHIDPEKITQKVHKTLQQIERDRAIYLETGSFERIEERIAEVRNLFDLLMVQLNELNIENKSVKGTLEVLASLDQSESTLRKIKVKQTQNAPTSNFRTALKTFQKLDETKNRSSKPAKKYPRIEVSEGH